MKKNLLLVAALAATMSAGAQSVYNFVDMDALGYDGSETTAAGTVFLENEYGTLVNGADQVLKNFSPTRAPYTHVAVGGGEAVAIKQGITGTDNPKGQAMDALPTSGMFYQLTTTKTGYFTILTKLNSNKNYWLLEGKNFAAYRLGVGNLSKVEDSMLKIEYTMPVDEYDILDLNSAEIGKYFNLNAETGAVSGPKVPWGVYDEGGADMGEGSGFIQFISYASEEAPITFTFFAQGSKMACDGFIFTPAEEPVFANAPSVVFSGVEKTNAETGEVTPAPALLVFGDVAGIENIAVDEKVIDVNAPVYNIYGQRVSKDTKGLLIQNGVKYYNR